MPHVTLTTAQRAALEAQQQGTRDARVLRRTQAVLWMASGRPGPEVAALLRVTPQSVYGWLARYRRTPHPEGLADQPRSGRPPRLGRRDRTRLPRLLAHSPERYGYRQTAWTVALLHGHLQRRTAKAFSPRTVRRHLHALGYRWKRPRYVLANRDPDRERKNSDSPSARAATTRYGHALPG